MARTIAEIYDSLNLVKGGMSELGIYVNNDAESIDTARKLVNDVRSASKVAIWRLWLWIVAVASWVIENTLDAFELKIKNAIAQDKPHTLNWYAGESKKFQLGHVINWVMDHFAYAVIDDAAKIVKYAAAIETETGITIKVMKAGRAVLELAELNAFKAFWARWKDAGVKLEFVSAPVNTVSFGATIYRNRAILNADNTLIANPAVNALTNPADAYLSSLDFNGTVYFLELIQAIKNQPGITNIVLGWANISEGAMGEEGLWTAVPASGFCEMNWAACVIVYSDIYE